MQATKRTTRPLALRRALVRAAWVLTSVAALHAGAAAQNRVASSPNYGVLVRSTPAGEVVGAKAGNRRATLRCTWVTTGNAASSSPSYQVSLDTLGLASFAPSGPPLVAHVGSAVAGSGAKGTKLGGTKTTVFGLRLVDSNGQTAVSVGGSTAVAGAATSTQVVLETGPGLNAYGNPLGPSDVVVDHAGGSGARTDAFTYQPAVRNLSSASIGEVLQLEYTSDLTGTLYQVWGGGIFPGVAIPIAPFAGALEVWNPAFDLTPLLFAAANDASVPIFVPADPTLVGATLWIQGVSISELVPALVGSFTNAETITFQP
jgi:hypothetical protein